MKNISKTIAITMGDPGGIGPEIISKGLLNFGSSVNNIILFGALSPFRRLAKKFTWAKEFLSRINTGAIKFVCSAKELDYPIGIIDKNCGEAAYSSIISAVDYIKKGKADALVTLPVSKKSIIEADYDFIGHTDLLAGFLKCETTMMLFSGNFRVALVTTHIPLKNVPKLIENERILRHIKRLNEHLIRFFDISKPKIEVLGLNPHSGEDGELGDEESEIILAIKFAQEMGIEAEGPLVPDTAFLPLMRRKFDAFLAMYHDQGLIPLKTLGFEHGVNFTLGLPFPRTSPDHGTAFDIAGKGIASPISFIESLKAAIRFARIEK